MLLCVFGLTNQVWEFLEIDAEHVCLFEFFFWDIKWKSCFGRSGLNTYVFEKHFISYSCILFIKSNALRSFWSKMIDFSKLCFFQNFDQSKVIFDRSKMFKTQYKSFWLARSVQACFGSIEGIFDRSNVIFDRSKIVLDVFKKEFSTWSSLPFQKLFKPFVSSPTGQAIFGWICRFLLNFLHNLSLPRPVRHLCPFFCFYFHISCIHSCIFGVFSQFSILVVLDWFLALSFSKESWVFVGTPYLSTLCGLFWLIWCFVEFLKF